MLIEYELVYCIFKIELIYQWFCKLYYKINIVKTQDFQKIWVEKWKMVLLKGSQILLF